MCKVLIPALARGNILYYTQKYEKLALVNDMLCDSFVI